MIIINGRFLKQRITGVQRFAYEITKELIANDSNVKIIVPKSYKDTLPKETENLFKEYFIFEGAGEGLVWEQFVLPLCLKQNMLLLNFCNSAPILWRNKLTCVHDMSYKSNPQWFSRKVRLYYSVLIPSILRTSKYIITVSEFAKAEIFKYVKGIGTNTIEVIYNACAEVFRNDSFPDNKNFNSKILLFVGSIEPRKNLDNLLAAFAKIEDPEARLIIVGKQNTKMFNHVNLKLDSDNRILWKHSCKDEELKELYISAKALVNPSLYEGFGVPLIEAASNACLLLLSKIPVFIEVANGDACFFDPYDTNNIADTLKGLLNLSPVEANKMAQKAYLNIAKSFSWKNSADKLYKLIKGN
ncbi:glycosyltransferase family 1 protein [uncultured Mucilaginibacter sp.]|uniref:glycosyltransferase family 4 protein n=1 Tax=uncultured Mucilaginibacter sp. TaxID=797541 RepID=UPI0025D6D3F3|nr:glycosyltransferase family 1 protein [uncultured Mucilaginibacter sp.]